MHHKSSDFKPKLKFHDFNLVPVEDHERAQFKLRANIIFWVKVMANNVQDIVRPFFNRKYVTNNQIQSHTWPDQFIFNDAKLMNFFTIHLSNVLLT